MAKQKLSVRQEAVLRYVWVLNYVEKNLMDRFFLVHDVWKNIEKDIVPSEEHACMFLREEGEEYMMILLDPLPRLRAVQELGLSFRVNFSSGMKVVLIKVWEEKPAPRGRMVVERTDIVKD
jgi:hypothetical protein